MPRTARKKSETGIYHVMLRGINQQQIFEDKEDCEKFLQILFECQQIGKFKLYAYCLMGNHIHLMLEVGEEPIEQTFRRIGSKFVYWYNVKYQRIGHLFQDRFKSECVEDEKYLLTVIRYIHQNPVKAGLCDAVSEWEYSSYREYIAHSKIVEFEKVFNLVGEDEFYEFNNTFVTEKCLDIEESAIVKLTDEQVKREMRKRYKCETVSDFQSLPEEKREKIIVAIHSKGGSIRQISRLTGAPKGLVERLLKKP